METEVVIEKNGALPSKYPPARKGRIAVWGMLAGEPYGGMTWQVLHHLAGFRRLGFDVWYVEDSETPLKSPTNWWPVSDPSDNVRFLAHQMGRIGLGDRWIFRPPGVWDFTYGARDLSGLRELYKEADVVFNLCGANKLRADHESIRSLALLQTDPVAPQVQVAQGNLHTMREFDAYEYLFTYGENFGAPDCLVPLERYRWRPTRPPVCVDWWETKEPPAVDAPLTTVGNWDNEGKDIDWNGETYSWRKRPEFQRLLTLPSRASLTIELALVGIQGPDQAEMRSRGWRIISALELSAPGGVSGLHPELARRIHRLQRPECPPSQRLVQRSKRLLSCRWPASDYAMHRI